MEKKKHFSLRIKNKEFSVSFVLTVLSSLLGMLFSFLAAKYLEAELYGEIHYYLSLITLLSSFMVFGVDNYVIKNLQFSKSKTELMTKVYQFIILTSMLILPLYFRIAISFLDRLHSNSSLILLIFFVALVCSTGNIAFSYYQARNKFEIRVLSSSFIPHVGFLLVFLIHFLTNSLHLFTSMYLFYYTIFYGAFGIYILFKTFKSGVSFFKRSEIVSIIYLGLSYVLYNITTPISNVIIGERYESFGIVGIYSVSNQVLSISSLATSIVGSISCTVFAKLSNKGDFEELFSYYKKICRITIYLAVPFYTAFILESGNIFAFFGESYTGYNLILILMSISSAIEVVTGPCGTVLLMGGKEKNNFFASVVKLIVFLLLTSILINYTIYAAPIAMIVSSVVANSLKLFFVRLYTKRTFVSFEVIICFLYVVVISFGCFFGLSFITNQVAWLISNCIIGLAVIILLIVFSPFKRDKLFFTKGKDEI